MIKHMEILKSMSAEEFKLFEDQVVAIAYARQGEPGDFNILLDDIMSQELEGFSLRQRIGQDIKSRNAKGSFTPMPSPSISVSEDPEVVLERLTRKIMEEKGPITEFDVARVEKGLGNVTAPLEDKIFLLNELRNKIRQAIMNKNESAGISEEEFAKMKPEFYKKLISGIKPLQGQDNLRQQAIQELQSAGAPVTEANINEAMRQLGGQ